MVANRRNCECTDFDPIERLYGVVCRSDVPSRARLDSECGESQLFVCIVLNLRSGVCEFRDVDATNDARIDARTSRDRVCVRFFLETPSKMARWNDLQRDFSVVRGAKGQSWNTVVGVAFVYSERVPVCSDEWDSPGWLSLRLVPVFAVRTSEPSQRNGLVPHVYRVDDVRTDWVFVSARDDAHGVVVSTET